MISENFNCPKCSILMKKIDSIDSQFDMSVSVKCFTCDIKFFIGTDKVSVIINKLAFSIFINHSVYWEANIVDSQIHWNQTNSPIRYITSFDLENLLLKINKLKVFK